MTINDVFERLQCIDQAVASLLCDTGFHSDDGLGGSVRHLPDACEDAFLRDKAEELLESLELLHEELSYLKKQTHGEYTLKQLPNGRYGYYDGDGKQHVFSCGQSLEAKIYDRLGRQRWVRGRIEHDGLDYFLCGFSYIPLSGLIVRERR